MAISTLLWLDFETTGLDLGKDQILEVACVLTDTGLNVISEIEMVLKPHNQAWEASLNDVVRDMHTQNNLIREVRQSNLDIEDVEPILLEWLANQDVDTSLMYLSGAGVSHFDYLWIQHHLPRLARKLAYSQIDISVVKRIVQLAGSDFFPKSDPKAFPEKAHRAMWDVRQALRDTRHFYNSVPALQKW